MCPWVYFWVNRRRRSIDALAATLKYCRITSTHLTVTKDRPMKMYNSPAGSNPKKVRMYCAEKGIDLELAHVSFGKEEHRSDDFKSTVNSLARLPVLELDDGTMIAESVAICRYLEELHPEPPLFGTTAVERALVEMWSRRMEMEVTVNVSNILRHTSPFFANTVVQVPEFADASRKTALQRFEWLNGELGDNTYLLGDQMTFADINGFVGFVMMPQVDLEIPSDLTNLVRWYETMASRPSADA
jgi:glutathione S-transferase